jgi:hypothetical protein
MNSKKFLTGTLVGGISFFLVGYLFYGLALAGFFASHSIAPAGSMKQMNEILWWALILGNLAEAALLTWIFLKLGNVTSFGRGFSTAIVIGFFMGLSMDLIRYATGNSVDLTATIADVAVEAVMSAIVGGIIGAVLGMGTKKA